MIIWTVLLFLVSTGLLIAGGVVETRHGFYKALPLSLSGSAGFLWAFYLHITVVFPSLFLANM
jgi:hypothetical protein